MVKRLGQQGPEHVGHRLCVFTQDAAVRLVVLLLFREVTDHQRS
jgi:hypothetical protein